MRYDDDDPYRDDTPYLDNSFHEHEMETMDIDVIPDDETLCLNPAGHSYAPDRRCRFCNHKQGS